MNGTPLQRLRREAGLTQQQFAPLVGICRRSLAAAEAATTALDGELALRAARVLSQRLGRTVSCYDLYGVLDPRGKAGRTGRAAQCGDAAGVVGKGDWRKTWRNYHPGG